MVNARFAPPGITNDLARLRKELRLTRVSEVELRIGATAEEQLQSLGRVFLKTQFVRQVLTSREIRFGVHHYKYKVSVDYARSHKQATTLL